MDITQGLNAVQDISKGVYQYRNDIKNIIQDKQFQQGIINQGIPSNFRMLALGVLNKINPDTMSGKNFTEKGLSKEDLQALRNLYIQANSIGDGTLQYGLYPNVKNETAFIDTQTGKGNNLKQMALRSANDPYYRVMTGIGRGYFATDKKTGNVYLGDRYDFPNKKEGQPISADFDKIHEWANKNTRPYNILINLGNPKDW